MADGGRVCWVFGNRTAARPYLGGRAAVQLPRNRGWYADRQTEEP
jgi:hypothetical protein